MGGQGSLPWSIGDIQPGDRGSEVTAITNMGSVTGYLRVWISGIEATDRNGGGAALARYMSFSLTADGLTTTLALPAAIDRFPASPTDRGQLVIGPIAAGTSASLRWNWEFVDNGKDQNDAQGDGLSFDISYMLTDAPPPAAAYKYMAVDIMGWQNVVETDSAGVVQHDVDAVDPLGIHHLAIRAGTRIIDEEGSVPGRIVLSVVAAGLDAAGPVGAVPVSPVYLLEGRHPDGTAVDLTFSAPVVITIGVNASSVPAGYLPMGVHMLSGDGWSRLPAAGDLSRWTASGMMGHTGVVSVFAAPVMGENSALHVTDMVVRPEVRDNGWPVTISTTVGRSVQVIAQVTCGSNSSGIYRAELLIDGVAMNSTMLALEPEESTAVVVTASGIEDGEHTAAFLDRSVSFRTGTSVDWALIIISNAAVFSSLLIVRQRHLVHNLPSTSRRAPEKGAVRAPRPPPQRSETANPQFLDSIGERWEARRAEAKKEPPAPAPPETANPQFLESIGEVWEARRTAEQVVERQLRRRPPGRKEN